jgi:hypothetical protein
MRTLVRHEHRIATIWASHPRHGESSMLSGRTQQPAAIEVTESCQVRVVLGGSEPVKQPEASVYRRRSLTRKIIVRVSTVRPRTTIPGGLGQSFFADGRLSNNSCSLSFGGSGTTLMRDCELGVKPNSHNNLIYLSRDPPLREYAVVDMYAYSLHN